MTNTCACADCGHEQLIMDPCGRCSSRSVHDRAALEVLFGAGWQLRLQDVENRTVMTDQQARVYASSLPVGDLQRRVIRGEEDGYLDEILDAFEAQLAYRRSRQGGYRHTDDSLTDTISICRNRRELLAKETA